MRRGSAFSSHVYMKGFDMRRFTKFEVAVGALLVIAAAAQGLFGVETATGEGQDKDVICHNGVELVVADPAIFQAHLDHGDCAGTCADCLGRCCWVDSKGIAQTALVYQDECKAIGGLYPPSTEAPCPTFGD